MIFITGGTGLVGSHILLYLSKENISFRALKREESSLRICKRIFKFYNAKDLFNKINWIEGDVNDIPSLEEGMKDCTKVIHAAAILSFHKEDQNLMWKVNVEGTANVMNVAIEMNVKKVAYISSIAALGRNSTTETVDENCYFIESKKESNYAISKYYSEQEVWRASEEGMNVVILNPSVILGPGDWSKGSSQIFETIYNGLKFYTNGSTGYVDVIDVAKCTIKLLNSNIRNERFIINGENLSYRETCDSIASNFNKPKATIKVTPFLREVAWRLEFIRSLFTNKRPLLTKETIDMSMTKSYYSNKKIIDTIGHKFIPIQTSIKNYCDWFISSGKLK